MSTETDFSERRELGVVLKILGTVQRVKDRIQRMGACASIYHIPSLVCRQITSEWLVPSEWREKELHDQKICFKPFLGLLKKYWCYVCLYSQTLGASDLASTFFIYPGKIQCLWSHGFHSYCILVSLSSEPTSLHIPGFMCVSTSEPHWLWHPASYLFSIFSVYSRFFRDKGFWLSWN